MALGHIQNKRFIYDIDNIEKSIIFFNCKYEAFNVLGFEIESLNILQVVSYTLAISILSCFINNLIQQHVLSRYMSKSDYRNRLYELFHI